MAAMLAVAMGGPSYSAVGGGGTNTTTYTTSTRTVTHTAQEQINITNYQTSVLGVSTVEDLSGDGNSHGPQTVYSATFSGAPNSAEVQLALQTAAQDVYSDLSAIPARGSIVINGVTVTDAAGATDASVTGAASVSHSSSSTSVTAAPVTTGSNVSATTTMYIGPQTIMVGDNQSQSFTIVAGGVDYDTLYTTDLFQTVTTTTTTTDTTAYTVNGQKTISPIVLNLDGSGKLEASGGNWTPHPQKFYMAHRVLFDFYGNGFPVAMEWVGPHDGLLCRPKTDGSVDGTCLFGTGTGFANGYENMAAIDENLDGRLSGKELKGLSVWQDRNGNARVNEGELKSLKELGITELSVNHKNFKSTFTMKGKTCTMFDWWPNTFEVKKIKRSV